METEELLAKAILNAAFKIHTDLGQGLLESAYEECLSYELEKNGLLVEKQKILPLRYCDLDLKAGYRLDLLVENKVVIEVKAVETIKDVHIAQTLTYLRLTKCKLGLLLNFNVKYLKYGIKRVVI
ncbi:GxxExxY protein [Litoribacter populi]|uniref:GxxExxY protein n=1 Tax=Litoribacter populi TaxID=2598460 RepID=UPI00117C07B1|nr:GxxExxY protein [Litoribacter populi]